MEKGALSEAGFGEFAEQVVLFCHITSRVESDKHQNLLSEKGGRGFPYLVMMDEKGNVIASHSGPRTIAGFEGTLGKANAYVGLLAKAAGGDAEAAVELFQMQVQMGHYKPEDARKKMASLKGITPELKAELEQTLVDLEIQTLLGTARSQADLTRIGKDLAAMAKEGKVAKNPNQVINFWFAIAKHAEEAKDAPVLEEAIEKLKGETGRNPRLRGTIDQLEQALEKIKDTK